ncbi:hypothetical protein HPB48_004165 [Haemaphysalis longicornis]|uniref:Uncharacterized protein n=1 Tax=Haemaphysalis longicornis TaxID=44386 RepID=A0A9J6FSM7_HAELO|nr:hypothetical protein HPB48_004165 [Haemaphysalis longicornis]
MWKAGLTPPDHAKRLPRSLCEQIVVTPLPRNMHPERNRERRTARARTLAETYSTDNTAVYVDAARYPRRPRTYVATVIRATDSTTMSAASFAADNATQAEEAASALALRSAPTITTILSDAKSAIVNYSKSSVGPPAHRFLRPLPDPKTNTTHLRWFPAHVGLIPGGVANRNEKADAVARELTHRAAPPRLSNTARAAGYDGEGDEEQGKRQREERRRRDYEPLLEYGDILRYYKEQRRTQPPPHPGLNRHEQVLLRQLQTRTVITPALARYVCPGRFKDYMCSECAIVNRATLSHILQAHRHHPDEQGGGRVNTGAVRDPQCCDTPNPDTADACANAECASDTCENTTSANTTPTDIHRM